MRTAIVGLGMVGGALSKVLEDPILYDPPKKIGNTQELNEADVVFICVPTPFENECDTSLVEKTIQLLEKPKIIVIKSTVIPGTTDALQDKYFQHKILFNPEFLTEATADQDMKYPDRQIIGYTKRSKNVAGDIMMMLPLSPFERIVPAKEAEMAKYFNNSWFATKVVFANQIYDICKKTKIDYDTVKEIAAFDKRVGRSHLDIWHKGYRGFGGKCLPKDLKALIAYARKNKVNPILLRTVNELNRYLNRCRKSEPKT